MARKHERRNLWQHKGLRVELERNGRTTKITLIAGESGRTREIAPGLWDKGLAQLNELELELVIRYLLGMTPELASYHKRLDDGPAPELPPEGLQRLVDYLLHARRTYHSKRGENDNEREFDFAISARALNARR